MSHYDINFEIIYSIKSGNHTFEKIWMSVNGKDGRKKIGSKSTLSKHLTQLVNEGAIYKNIEDGKISYELGGDFENGTSVFDNVEKDVEKLTESINTLPIKSKKLTDKKLLQSFIERMGEIQDETSHICFQNIVFQRQKDRDHEGDDYVETYLALNNKRLELFNKLIMSMMDVLEKRDPELLEIFNQSFD